MRNKVIVTLAAINVPALLIGVIVSIMNITIAKTNPIADSFMESIGVGYVVWLCMLVVFCVGAIILYLMTKFIDLFFD